MGKAEKTKGTACGFKAGDSVRTNAHSREARCKQDGGIVCFVKGEIVYFKNKQGTKTGYHECWLEHDTGLKITYFNVDRRGYKPKVKVIYMKWYWIIASGFFGGGIFFMLLMFIIHGS